MTRRDWHRFWMHFPIGMLGAWMVYQHTALGIMLTIYFLTYEVMNDWRKQDRSYKDVIGAAWGYGLVGAMVALGVI